MNIGDTFQQTTEDGTIIIWKVVAKVPVGFSEFGDIEWLGDEVKVVEIVPIRDVIKAVTGTGQQ